MKVPTWSGEGVPTEATASSADDFFGQHRVMDELSDEQTSRMKALLETGRRMSAMLDEDELLEFLMAQVLDLMDADHGYLVLIKSGTDHHGLHTSTDDSWEVKVARARGKNEISGAPSGSLIRRVLEEREPVRWDDALNDAGLLDSRSAHELGLRSVMAVPLLTRERLIGALLVENRGRFASFNEEHLDFLQIFGHQAAVAIENARMYRSLRDAQTQLSKAHRALKLEVEESHETLRHERQRLQHLEGEVRHMDKMAALGVMVSQIAHEVNNPLTGVLGFSQMLELSPRLNERDRAMLGKITAETTRCAEIIRNLLKFSRKSNAERVTTDFNRLVSEAIDLRRYQFSVNNVELFETYEQSIGTFLIDQYQLKGVVLNILNNAFDAIQSRRGSGIIAVYTELNEQGEAVCRVVDDGGGIQEPEKVFDPFYTTKDVGKGTGLGLSVAYGVVKSHGGSVEARNVEGGAEVQITLPREQADETQPAQRTELPPIYKHRDARILVVDDEVVIRELCQALLEGEGFDVVLAFDGLDAVRALEAGVFDLVITDIRMPGSMSGVDVFRWIKKNRPELEEQVLFITGDLLTNNLRDALGEVGHRLLTKPFQVATLLELVHRTLVRQPPEN